MLAFGIPAKRAPEPTGFLVLEDGGYLLNEDGGRISLNVQATPPTHGIEWQVVYDQLVNSQGTIRPTFTALKYANGRYVAVGYSSVTNRPYAVTSTDGIVWTEVAPVAPAQYPAGATRFSCVTYSPALDEWMLVAPHTSGSMIYISPDNLASFPSALESGLTNIASFECSDDSTFVALSANISYVSGNRQVWDTCLFNGAVFRSVRITYQNGLFFALDTYQGTAKNLYSADGYTWQEFVTTRNFNQLLWLKDKWWAIDGVSVPYYSVDLITWTQAVFSASVTVLKMAYTDGTYLVGGFISGQGSIVATSQDGINFLVRQSPSFPLNNVENLIGADGKFLWHMANGLSTKLYLSL